MEMITNPEKCQTGVFRHFEYRKDNQNRLFASRNASNFHHFNLFAMLPSTTSRLFILSISFCLMGSFAKAQTSTDSVPTAQAPVEKIPITGIIYNDKGEPLDGASVAVKGKTQGTTTDKTGTFTLNADPSDILIISYNGYETLQTSAASTMHLTLHQATSGLSDVVVIGYGTQSRKVATGASTTVGRKDFQTGIITSPEDLIAGKIAGVSVIPNSGSPNGGSTIRIRGGASLTASNDPLIVVNDVPLSGNDIPGATGNTLSLINPNDIESFTVLKDAAATAIYGSRASNGVIMITTKKGTAGKPVFNFSTSFSVSTLAKEADLLSAAQFRQYVDSLGGGLYDPSHTYKSLLGNANTDWQKEIYQTALSTDNNLSISGTTHKVPYYASVGYLNSDGILKTDSYERLTGSITVNPRFLHDHLHVDINLRGAASNSRFGNGAAVSSAAYFDPTQPVYDASSPYGGYYEWTTGAGASKTLNKLAPRNPVALLNLYHNLSTVQRSIGNIKLDYSLPFLPELHLNANLGYDVAYGQGTINVPAYAAQNFLDGGQANKYSGRLNNGVAEYYLSYNKTIKSIKSNINAVAGYGYYGNQSTTYNYASYRANGDTIPNSNPNFPKTINESRMRSYYARLIYTFKNKYILSGTIRADGSSKFPGSDNIFAKDNHRWGSFPSIAATWRIKDESFLQNVKPLSDLKLRASYGTTGQQDGINQYGYQSVYSTSDNTSQVQFGNSFYNMGTPAPYNSQLTWEQTNTLDFGLDYGFLKNRITGTFDIYYRKTKNLLNYTPIPAGSNFSPNLTANVGDVNSNGVEFSISATPVLTKHVAWDVSFNVAYQTYTITNLTATKDSSYPGTPNANGFQINSVNYDLNSYYVYHQLYGQDGKPIEGAYKDVNGDGLINEKDLYHYKSSSPKYILGFSTQLTVDRWTLSTVLRANFGNYVYNQIAANSDKSNVFNTLGYLANSTTDIYNTGYEYGQPLSDYNVQNAAFLKMDNLGLSYNMGKVWRNRLGIRINANCQNVFTITKYTGIDPEVYGGIDNGLYPHPRIFSLGLNLQY
jgi:TonB-linked SusC/RagA family outer membrane protein